MGIPFESIHPTARPSFALEVVRCPIAAVTTTSTYYALPKTCIHPNCELLTVVTASCPRRGCPPRETVTVAVDGGTRCLEGCGTLTRTQTPICPR